MGQDDVVAWLRNRRLCGDASFFTPADIGRGLRLDALSNIRVHECASKLHHFGVLEVRWFGTRRAYRLRREFVGGKS